MPQLAKNRVSFSILISILIILITTLAIFWARGFKPNLKDGSIDRTGLIVLTSSPTGASVYLDDRLTSATNTNIAFLDPKTYKVRLEKDGYITWEKNVTVRADLATEIEAVLFPLAPSIAPITTTGASNPTLSPDSGKIVYGVSGERGGVYIVTMDSRPFPFRQDLRLVAKNQTGFDFSKASFIWSPDSKQVIAEIKSEDNQIEANILLDADKSEQDLRDITASKNATLSTWQQEIDTSAQTKAITVPEDVKNSTSSATTQDQESEKTTTQINYYPTKLMFSPDEQKVLYKDGEIYKIYNLKDEQEFTLPNFENLINISWYADSQHLVVVQENLISIIETDGTNNTTVYSGTFVNGHVFSHPSGSRLIILTTLTQTEGSSPNLYSIDLR
jgi:hypothetical protein